MIDLSFGVRMSCKTFETEFCPKFRDFSFAKAKSVLKDLIARQDHQETAILVAQTYQNKRLADKKFVCSFAEFCQKHSLQVHVDLAVKEMIRISANPSQFRTPCSDSGLDVWLHGGKIYAVIRHFDAANFQFPPNVDAFGVEKEFDHYGRMPTWKKVFAESDQMRLEIIKASAKIGLDQIAQQMLVKEAA